MPESDVASLKAGIIKKASRYLILMVAPMAPLD